MFSGVLSFWTHAKMSKDDIFLTFTQANQTFSQANDETDDAKTQELYQQAIIGYEKIITDGGIHNAKLYYNLANSYLLTNQLGKAIINYRRAEQLDSTDPDIHKNLNYARSKRIDQFATTSKKKVLQRLFFWHYDFSMQTRLIIGGISLTILCLWLTLKTWIMKWPAVLPISSIMLITLICMTASIVIEFHTIAKDQNGVIVSESVIARQGDGMNYPQSFTDPLHEGVEFELLESRPGWLHIKLSNDLDTWIPDHSAELM
jgi:hypothetical protein